MPCSAWILSSFALICLFVYWYPPVTVKQGICIRVGFCRLVECIKDELVIIRTAQPMQKGKGVKKIR